MRVDNSGNSDSFSTAMSSNQNYKEFVMMKRVLLASLVGAVCFSGNLNAVNPYQSLRSCVVGLGETVDSINIPLIGKILPLAMAAACLKECPGQSMIVLGGLLTYVLLQNESVRIMLNKYNLLDFAVQNNNETIDIDVDGTLFVFDGEEEEDALEEAEMEDVLLQQELLLDEEYYDAKRSKKLVEQSSVAFL